MIRRAHEIGPSFLPEDDLSQYLNEIGKNRVLDRREEAYLLDLAREGDRKALHALVQANLRFVVTVAMGYRNRGVPLCDLISEGNLGLMRAAERFEPSQGVRFISYAVWWIRQAILLALSRQAGAMTLSPSWTLERARVRRTEQRLLQRLGRMPRLEETAAATGSTETTVREHQAPNPFGVAQKGEPDFRDFPDSLPSDRPEAASDRETAHWLLRKHLDAAFTTLTDREAEVIRRFFGIGLEDPESLETIGRSLGLSRERIRQIKDGGLAKLRRPGRLREMREAREWLVKETQP